jgi:CoA:oxalate CoA-transferase
MSEPTLPLDDIRVLDLTHFYNGPYATMLLGYLGAEVIKVEAPERGDGVRALYRRAAQPFGMPFALLNFNKRSVTLNLKSDRGKEIFLRMVRGADVLVENFAAGSMEKMGLGYDLLREINPRLVYATGTGYGLTGPNRNLVAYDPVVQAMTGIMAVTGERDGPPLKAGAAVVDFMSGIHLCAGVLAALRQRDRTGKGLLVELSLQESILPTLTSQIGAYYGAGIRQLRDGNRSPGGEIVPYNSYPASDGWVMMMADTNARWVRLCEIIGRPQLAHDPRFAKARARTESRDEVDRIVSEWTHTRTRLQIMEELSANDILCGIVKELPEVMTDPHLLERGTLREVDHPLLGRMTIFTSPLRLNGEPNVPRSPSPALGADNDRFYGEELGLSAPEIQDLRDAKII